MKIQKFMIGMLFSFLFILPAFTTDPVYQSFLGKEQVGEVTNTTAKVHLYPSINVEVYVEYDIHYGLFRFSTPMLSYSAGTPIVIPLSGLLPNRRHFYRLIYKEAGTRTFYEGEIRTFHTQRASNNPFTFVITSDEHPWNINLYPEMGDLYNITLNNILQVYPDFMISLGDFGLMIDDGGIVSFQDALDRYLHARGYLDQITHSIPFYLTLGNHEGESGWLLPYSDSPIWATQARKQIIQNPSPGAFFSGSRTIHPDFGYREDYYAWEWGDALFVVLSPYWYCPNNPKDLEDGWAWTLGEDQYNWLNVVLSVSEKPWKFVFIHHLMSTSLSDSKHPYYGRGGVEIARYSAAGNPSFEWGGEDENGNQVFAIKRPRWAFGAIHDLLLTKGVDIVFHGHDHLYARQSLDGIIYQECPVPNNAYYNKLFQQPGQYFSGTIIPNSGHLEVTVDQAFVEVKYIRAFLPGDGLNGVIADSYFIQ